MAISKETLFSELEGTPSLLMRIAFPLSDGETHLRGPHEAFSLVENVWHMADLEREGFGSRIERLLTEIEPALPNFDGDRLARERAYQERTVQGALSAFAEARATNLRRLRSVSPGDWTRAGRQEGVGVVTLGDIPCKMLEHDASHLSEISELLIAVAPTAPLLEVEPHQALPCSPIRG